MFVNDKRKKSNILENYFAIKENNYSHIMNENIMNSEKDLVEAIKDLLKKNGHLNKLQAEVIKIRNHFRFFRNISVYFNRNKVNFF